MKEILDELDEIIYIANPQTYNLLFINKYGREQLKFQDYLSKNLKCYQVIHNRQSPCPFCTNCRLSKTKTYEWEFFNPVIGKHFSLKDKLIEWPDENGHIIDARLEIGNDITEEKLTFTQISRTAKTEAFIIDCIKELHQNMNLEIAINTLLYDVGKFVESDRTYIYSFNFNNNSMTLTQEWTAQNALPTSENMKNCSISIINRWMTYFRNNNYVYIDDVELYSRYLDEYKMLKEENVQSLIAVPITLESGELIGFLGIDNPSPKISIQHIQLICNTLSYFIISMIERRLIEKKLEEQSFTDSLTQMRNRNKFMADIESFNLQLPLFNMGIAYVDMNGLKEINDNQGHALGDKALRAIANILCTLFDSENCYRIGGDEFVVLFPDTTEEIFNLKIQKLKEFSGKNNNPAIAIGAQWYPSISNLNQTLKIVDKLMYNDKNQFYINNNINRRKF
ncbi:MAG: diguanylate cyclase [Treponema sp.]|nr:diguanylate cyclase [Treponema sp.]